MELPGNELIARSIQRNSTQVKGPLLPINFGGIPGTLMEAHLFGHQKGTIEVDPIDVVRGLQRPAMLLTSGPNRRLDQLKLASSQ